MQIRSILARTFAAGTLFLGLYHTCQAQEATSPPHQGVAGQTGARVAVVDLDRVARDMGWLNDMQKDLSQCSNQLQSDVKQFTGIYEQQFRALTQPTTKEGAGSTAPASAELTRDAVAARQQVLQLRQKADQLYAAYRQKLVMHYREALTPIVRQVAHSHNQTVVLLKSDTVLLVEPEADITNEVLSAARAKPPEVGPIPVPRLDAPLELTLPGGPTTEPSLKP